MWISLKRFSYWLPALVVALLCAPWYVLTADLAREGWSASYEPSWLIREPAAENAWHLIHIAGAPVFVLALLGVTYELWPRRGKAVNHGLGNDGRTSLFGVAVPQFHRACA